MAAIEGLLLYTFLRTLIVRYGSFYYYYYYILFFLLFDKRDGLAQRVTTVPSYYLSILFLD